MEEKILEILDNNTTMHRTYPVNVTRRYKASKEIKAHVFEFIEWITSFRNEHIDRCGTGWRIPNIKSDEPYKEYSIKEVYSYWLNIKK